MVRLVECAVLKKQSEGLQRAPHPGELGQKIYQQVSLEGWRKWLERLAVIINENGLNTADPATIAVIEDHMKGFLFGEGQAGGLPQGFSPMGGGKK